MRSLSHRPGPPGPPGPLVMRPKRLIHARQAAGPGVAGRSRGNRGCGKGGGVGLGDRTRRRRSKHSRTSRTPLARPSRTPPRSWEHVQRGGQARRPGPASAATRWPVYRSAGSAGAAHRRPAMHGPRGGAADVIVAGLRPSARGRRLATPRHAAPCSAGSTVRLPRAFHPAPPRRLHPP